MSTPPDDPVPEPLAPGAPDTAAAGDDRTGRRKRGRQPRHGRSPLRRFLVIALAAGLVLAACGLALLSWSIERAGISPRRVASYVEQRVHGRGAVAGALRQWTAVALQAQDRGGVLPVVAQGLRIGAQPEAVGANRAPGSGRTVPVADTASATAAFAGALAGDVILLAPGTYRFAGRYLSVSRPGTAGQPIVVRAARPGTAMLEFDMQEGLLVTAPYWRFENLDIRGVCVEHSYCDHAFHVVGGAHHFVARNNTIHDFNAHFKINGAGGRYPDAGLIEANSISNSTVRATGNPVITIDLVAASDWMVRGNLISDVIKADGGTSYGAYFKGAGWGNVFENNIVYCESRLHDPRSQQVGLSLGGGGTGKPYCRDRQCIAEQDRGVIRGNLIAACTDDGIYINRSARSTILHNTLIDTGGISVRFAASSADVEGNLVDGAIRARDDAILREVDNRDTSLSGLFLGLHPVRKLLAAAGGPDGRGTVAADMPRRAGPGSGETVPDLCGRRRAGAMPYGAFENFADCLREPAAARRQSGDAPAAAVP